MTGSQLNPDAANPRVYTDIRGAATAQSGNPNGHIVRMKENGDEPGATAFTWDIYLFGAEAGAPSGIINLSGLTDEQDLSSPDGLVFTPSTGLCWVQTDDGAYTDITNCMMLAAVPGTVGDGEALTLDYGATAASPRASARSPRPARSSAFSSARSIRRSPACAKRRTARWCSSTCSTRAKRRRSPISPTRPSTPATGRAIAGYGAGGATARPRSATVMITKNDGGRVGT